MIPFSAPMIGGYIQNPQGYSYRILGRISEGAFGVVYLGVDIFEREYAIKVFKPTDTYENVRSSWGSELEILWRLRHPNITYIFDAFEYQHGFYLVLEPALHTLESFVTGNPLLNESQILDIARQLMNALAFVHGHSIIHRDLSPQNVLVYPHDVVKISDFGISEQLVPWTDPHAQRLHNQALVCPDLLTMGFSTAQSDLYHVGLILLSLTMGRPPIDPSFPPEQIRDLVLQGVPRILAEQLGTPLGKRIAILLRRRAEYRYHSVMEAWNDIRALLPLRRYDT